MTPVPNCSVHGTPMRAGKKPGEYYCSRRIGEKDDGSPKYCDQRIAGQKQQVVSAPANQSPVTDVVIVSYDIAARVLQGTAVTPQELAAYALMVRNDIRSAQTGTANQAGQ